jgi:hypothetical protein
MAESLPISDAYYEGVAAVVAAAGLRPLPKGVTAVEAGDWELAVNNGREPIDHDGSPLGAWELRAVHKVFLVIVILNPVGGCLGGGMPEDEFIAQMRAISGCKVVPV